MRVGKNTARPASVEFLRLRKNYARAGRKPFQTKTQRSGFRLRILVFHLLAEEARHGLHKLLLRLAQLRVAALQQQRHAAHQIALG